MTKIVFQLISRPLRYLEHVLLFSPPFTSFFVFLIHPLQPTPPRESQNQLITSGSSPLCPALPLWIIMDPKVALPSPPEEPPPPPPRHMSTVAPPHRLLHQLPQSSPCPPSPPPLPRHQAAMSTVAPPPRLPHQHPPSSPHLSLPHLKTAVHLTWRLLLLLVHSSITGFHVIAVISTYTNPLHATFWSYVINLLHPASLISAIILLSSNPLSASTHTEVTSVFQLLLQLTCSAWTTWTDTKDNEQLVGYIIQGVGYAYLGVLLMRRREMIAKLPEADISKFLFGTLPKAGISSMVRVKYTHS